MSDSGRPSTPRWRAGPSATGRRPPSRASCRCASGSRGWSTRSSFAEEALLANWEQEGLGADGVVTGLATIGGRRVALMANDPTVKAGLLGPEDGREDPPHPGAGAARSSCRWSTWSTRPGRGSPTRCRCSPGRRGAGRIFHNEVRLSGQVPQVCLLFGPSAAGGAYIPAFCDVVIMRDGNASMYLGSPRMAEMVIGEKVTLEEMGGAKMHTSVSGCGHFLVETDEDAIDLAKRYLSYMPAQLARGAAGRAAGRARRRAPRSPRSSRPTRTTPFDIERADRRAASTPTPSSRSTSAGRRSWSSATRGSTAA